MRAITSAILIHGFSLEAIIVTVIVLIAAAAILMIVSKAMNFPIPPWVIQIFWVCVIAFVAIVAIKFVFSL